MSELVICGSRGYGKKAIWLMMTHLASLNDMERQQDLVHIIRTEPSDDFLRFKLKVIFSVYSVYASRDFWEQAQGNEDKFIELIIQHRHDEKEIPVDFITKGNPIDDMIKLRDEVLKGSNPYADMNKRR